MFDIKVKNAVRDGSLVPIYDDRHYISYFNHKQLEPIGGQDVGNKNLEGHQLL